MTQEVSERFWQAEARTEETKRFIRDINRITRRKFTAEEKIRIVLEGFRRDTPIRDLCRREGIRPSTYYAWLEDFMEAGKERLQRDTVRDATRAEVDSRLGKLYDALETGEFKGGELAPRIKVLFQKKDELQQAKAEAKEALRYRTIELADPEIVRAYV